MEELGLQELTSVSQDQQNHFKNNKNAINGQYANLLKGKQEKNNGKKFQSLEDIFGDTDTQLPTENKKDEYTSIDQIFGEQPAPSTDAALATYAYGDPDMPIGEESLLDVKLRGRLSAADTVNEKIAEFKKVYPDGDLLFVPGKGTPESTLEGVPSKYSSGEILFRPDTTTPYARLDGNYFKGGGQEFLADFAEFLYDDIGVLAGELAAGSKKVTKFMKPFCKIYRSSFLQYLLLAPV